MKIENIKIGIIYIATGVYAKFWEEFYTTCNGYFCVDAEKVFELFTDNEELLSMKYHNVNSYHIEDRGMIVNLLAKTEFTCQIASQLVRYDYVFYLNGNFKFLAPIYAYEIIPDRGNSYFTVLSFEAYKTYFLDQLPYDRNPDSQAFIPYGEGKHYYQGGFYGGSPQAMLEYAEWSQDAIAKDFERKVVAQHHDESYLNRYLLGKTPKVINDKYAYHLHSHYEGSHKAVLLDKSQVLGIQGMLQLKRRNDSSLFFLLDDQLRMCPIGIVRLVGGLGNQMFQFAYLYYMQKKMGRPFYLDVSCCETPPSSNGYELSRVFAAELFQLLSGEMSQQVTRLSKENVSFLSERTVSVFQPIMDIPEPVAIYQGYWQCWQYAEGNAEALKTIFRFDETLLNSSSSSLLKKIRNSHSVSVHVRRGDYLSEKNTLIYGNICTETYYREAFERMQEMSPEPLSFFFFTNDPQWVKEHLWFEGSILVEGNEGEYSWQDLFLMSECHHHIIANSSFSWWGAWLGLFSEKKVIAPDTWYNGTATPDLIPEGWICLPVCSCYSEQENEANHLFLKEFFIHERGIKYGKMGIVLSLFRLARSTGKNVYEDFADNVLNTICESLSQSMPVGFSHGLCGIGWGVAYLTQQGFIDGDADEVLHEIDSYVIQHIHNRSLKDPGLDNGICGLGRYLLMRTALGAEQQETSVTMRLKEYFVYLIDWLAIYLPASEEDRNDILDFLGDLRKTEFYQTKVDQMINLCINRVTFPERLTVIIPFRIECTERLRNLKAVLRHLQQIGCRVLLLEASNEQAFFPDNASSNVHYQFIKDMDSIFHRTRYINELFRLCTTPVVAVWDTDVILPLEQLEKSVSQLLHNQVAICIPYNGDMKMLTAEQSVDYERESSTTFLQERMQTYESVMGRPSCGGLYLVNRDIYLHCGGENEHFYGWGAEDAERIRRVEIMGYPVLRVTDGPLFHLWHPRGSNSCFVSSEKAFLSRQEFVKVCSMSRTDLWNYVESWLLA